jgi:HK97 family phage portal protein
VIVRSGGSNLQVKSAFLDEVWPYPVLPPDLTIGGPGAGMVGGGDPFWPFGSLETAMGLPALLGILLRLSTAVGMQPSKVYSGDQFDRETAVGSWQYELIHDRPGSEHTPFTLKSDITMSLAGSGYCCVRKYKARGRVIELLPLDSRRITPRRLNGVLVFDDRTEDGPAVVRDTSDIIYVRAPATSGGVVGLAPITLMRMGIGTGLKRETFEGLYYDRSAEPRVVITAGENVSPAQAQKWKPLWDDQHQGLANAHGTAIIPGGWKLDTIPVSLADAQFLESTRLTADQLGFVYGMPKVFMNTVDRPAITDNDWRYFVTFGLSWISTAIDQSFTADRDLFPPSADGAPRMHVETVSDSFLKPDIQTRYGAYLVARQAGWLSINEVRALENYPPVEGGDVLQVTPVGGAIDNTGSQDPPPPEKAMAQLLAEFDHGSPEQKAIVGRMRERANGSVHLPEPVK